MNTISITEQPNKKTSELLAMCKAKFSVWSYYDDDKLDQEFPAPKEATTRHFLEEQEPDKETLGLSVRQAEEKGFKNGITLRERILLELAYFEKTGKHLDIKGLTFCSGSRVSGGSVPCVDWDSDYREVQVHWCYLDNSYSGYGIRSAVSLNSSSSFPLGERMLDDVALLEAIDLVKSKGYKVIKEM